MASCSGSLIVHADGTVASCTNDDDSGGCAGRELRHDLAPRRCVDWWCECNYCGVHSHGARSQYRSRTGILCVRMSLNLLDAIPVLPCTDIRAEHDFLVNVIGL